MSNREIGRAIRNREMIRVSLKAGAKLSNGTDRKELVVEHDGGTVLFGIPTFTDDKVLWMSRWRVSIEAMAGIEYMGVDDVPPLDVPTDDYGMPTGPVTEEDIERWGDLWTHGIGIDTRSGSRGTVTL